MRRGLSKNGGAERRIEQGQRRPCSPCFPPHPGSKTPGSKVWSCHRAGRAQNQERGRSPRPTTPGPRWTVAWSGCLFPQRGAARPLSDLYALRDVRRPEDRGGKSLHPRPPRTTPSPPRAYADESSLAVGIETVGQQPGDELAAEEVPGRGAPEVRLPSLAWSMRTLPRWHIDRKSQPTRVDGELRPLFR